MRLLTDDDLGRESFAKDFETGCRCLSLALSGQPGSTPAKVSEEVITGAENALRWHTRWASIKTDAGDTWYHVEIEQAMQWLCLVVARWLEMGPADSGSVGNRVGEEAETMFRLAAMRVAHDGGGPRLLPPARN